MTRLASALEIAVDVLLGALILFTPLAFGSVETWAIVIIETTIFAIGSAWLLVRLLRGRGGVSTGLEVPIALFLGVVLLQIAPLPGKVIAAVSPRLATIYERTVPGFGRGPQSDFEEWLLASDAARSEISSGPTLAAVARPLSYDVPGTADGLVLFGAYALLFLVVADRYRETERFRRIVVWIVCVGVGIAIQGIFQKLTWNGKVLWFRSPNTGTRPFGPFVNPNHFAGYMELIVPLALGLLLTLLSRQAQSLFRRERAPDDPMGSPSAGEGPAADLGEREWNRETPGLPWMATHVVPKAYLLCFLLALSIGSIVLSLSRGGFLATLLTFAIFSRSLVPPVVRGFSRTGTLAALVAMLCGTLGIVYWLGASAIAERASTLAAPGAEPAFLSRVDAWRGTVDLFREQSVLGVGLGAFQTAFYRYNAAGAGVYAQAHNDYLQLLAEVGIVGAIPAALALFVFIRRRVVPAMRFRVRADRYLTLGLAMAIVSLLLHSFVDFNLQIPAVGFLFVVTGGLLTAAVLPAAEPTPAINRSSRTRMALLPAAAIGLAALACITSAVGVRRIVADNLTKQATQESDEGLALALLERAVRLAPGQPDIVTAHADRATDIFDSSYRRVRPRLADGRALLAKAATSYEQVAALVPCSPWGWWGLGTVYSGLGGIERLEREITLERLVPANEAELGRTPRLALAALRTAAFLEPNASEFHDVMAILYREEGMRAQALEMYRRAARNYPLYNKHSFEPANELPDDVHAAIVEGMEAALQELPRFDPSLIQKELGEMAYLRGNLGEAERRYRLGMSSARTKHTEEVLALVLGEVLRQQGKADEAVPLLERASRNRVVGWRALVSLGEIKEDAGEHKGARELYREAAMLAPSEIIPAIGAARETARCGDMDAAIGQVRYLIGERPPAYAARETLVQLLREGGRTKEALEEARALQKLAPSRTDYRRLVDALLRETGAVPTGGAAL